MDTPLVRPGTTADAPARVRVVAYFSNSAQGNMAIQLVKAYGVPANQIGVTTPERLPTNQGMVLSIPCPDEKAQARVEALCKSQGASYQVQRS